MIFVPGPGILAVSGAAVFQEPTVPPSPLPGGISTVVRLIFGLPQWLQIAGAALGALAGLAALVVLWRNRQGVWTWLTTRSRPLQVSLAAAAVVAVVAGAGAGAYGWNYMQHDNGFCTGCHVMGPSFARFTQSEHSQLTCHDCHQQSMFASMRQLYLWVAERPVEIGEHAPVANRVCEQCHAGGDKEVWQRIATTAGHRTHLESDSSALRGVMCVTCHGAEVHHFVPADSTCGGCHKASGIRLAGMQNQTALHCSTCHQFTAEVPRLATRDSASGTLRPGSRQCFSCHEMRNLLATFDPARDPHGGSCGTCHNPHTQARPADARKTCANSGCHADWRGEPFHVGASHRAVATQCLTCHQPHQAKVDAADCEGCHRSVRGRRGGAPPLPFDTTRALRQPARPISNQHGPPPPEVRGKGDSRPFEIEEVQADTFSHDRHKALPCLTCHSSTSQRSRLTFEAPRGCQICHHQATQTACATCHTPAALTPHEANVAVTVANRPARARTVRFEHDSHAAVTCTACHSTPLTMAPAAAVTSCTSCHDDHHAVQRSCASCHGGADLVAAHRGQPEPHEACDACHAPATVAQLVPTRTFCITCHADRVAHNAPRHCTTCHFQTSPDAYRAHLRKAEG